jgi:predicted nucleotidyltransferase
VPLEPSGIDPDRLRNTLVEFIDFLESHDVMYMVIGAMAVAIWGRPRATADIDFTLLTDSEGLETIGEGAERRGFVIDRQWLEWHPLQRGVQIRLTSADVFIDLVRPMDQHQEQALHRRRSIDIAGRTVWFVSPEDLIVMKLKAGRPRDFEDAVSVLARQKGRLDESYMVDWAVRIGVYDELAYVMGGGTLE